MDAEKKLSEVLAKYAVPDPKLVSKLPRGGIMLDFVGHAEITRILIEVDPCWSWEPIAFDADGLPAYRIENGMAHMAARLTIHGVSRIGIGSVADKKPDLLKELVSDFLRNAAMRFGIALNLWTKNEWEDLASGPKPEAPKITKTPVASTVNNVVRMNAPQDSRAKHPANAPSKAQLVFVEKEAKPYGDPVAVCGDIIGRDIQDLTELTVDEVKLIINNFNDRKATK